MISTNSTRVAVASSAYYYTNNKTSTGASSRFKMDPKLPPVFLQHLQEIQCMDGDKVELVTRVKGE